MKKRVAVEAEMTKLKDYLKSNGYTVETLDYQKNLYQSNTNIQAYVVTGCNGSLLDEQCSQLQQAKPVVIDAAGMPEEQVLHELNTQLE